MEARPYQQCVRCVMDTSDTEIVFDAEGRCNHCNHYFHRLAGLTYHGKASDEELERIVSLIKAAGRTSDYDCLVGISGGIDSTYVAYTLKNLGLRTLCVHMDNGWDSEISVRNIKHIVSKLGLDYESHVLDWDRFKDLQLSFLRASVPEAETPTDNAIQGVVFAAAKKHNIKYVISGGNFATEGILPKSWHYDAKDVKYLREIHRRFGSTDLGDFPLFGYRDWIYYNLKGIKTIYLLNFVPYSKKLALDVLQEKLAWRYYGGKHHESKYTGFVQSYLLFEKFNIDYRRATLSTQICAGEVSREEALRELVSKPYDPIKIEPEVQYFCKKLGISTLEFRDLMAEPPKTFRDYPNEKRFLEILYATYRWLIAPGLAQPVKAPLRNAAESISGGKTGDLEAASTLAEAKPRAPDGDSLNPGLEGTRAWSDDLVSVIIPAFNAERFVAETIESVRAQTYRHLEIIVVDDGSTDGTRDVVEHIGVRDARVRLLSQPNSGVSVARNAGAALSKGRFLAFLDADDTLEPDSVELIARKLASDESFGLVHCDYQKVGPNSERIGSPTSFSKEGWILDDLLLLDGSTSTFCMGSWLVRREIFERVGGFDPELSNSADHEFYFRVAKECRVGRVPKVGFHYRIHSSNMNSNNKLLEKDLISAYRKADEHNLFRNPGFRRRCYGHMYFVLAGCWWNGGDKLRGGKYLLRSISVYPPAFFRLTRKLRSGPSAARGVKQRR